MKMTQLLQSSIWRFFLMTIAPELMVLFGIKIFYPKATDYFDKLLRQLLSDHKKTRKFGEFLVKL